jgi:hypothetical protein
MDDESLESNECNDENSSTVPPLSTLPVDVKVDKVIQDAIRLIVKEQLSKESADTDIDAMIATCAEFMKSFIIMGYDFDDNAIAPIFYAKTDLEADALSHYMQQYFVSSMKHGG